MAAQQPLLPTLEPSSHVVAEAPAAKTKTITNAASLRPKAIVRGTVRLPLSMASGRKRSGRGDHLSRLAYFLGHKKSPIYI